MGCKGVTKALSSRRWHPAAEGFPIDGLDDRCLDKVFQTAGILFALVKEANQGGPAARAMGGKIHGFPVVPKGESGK